MDLAASLPLVGYDVASMPSEESLNRVRALTDAIGSSALPAVTGPTAEGLADEGDAQIVASVHIDTVLARVTRVTATLKNQDAGWDAVDQLAAQLLLADLGLVAGTWRSLGIMAGKRLDHAGDELRQTIREAGRILKDSVRHADAPSTASPPAVDGSPRGGSM